MVTLTLLSLSAELRNLIYLHTFTSDFAVEFGKVEIQHPLTQSCRQIRRESLAMYYASTKFNAHLRDGPITPLIHWLRVIGRDACLLVREIRLWDMHDNVLTILSPAAALRYLKDTTDAIRTLAAACSLPEDHALAPQHSQQLWEAVRDMGLGLRQIKEQYPTSSIVFSTSLYALTQLEVVDRTGE